MRMASKSVNRLNDKSEMWELTDKQRVVVNALAEYPDEGPKRIAEIASEALDDDTVSRSYVHPIKTKYGDLVNKQREIKENERFEGTEKTEGDPFASLSDDLEDTGAWQLFEDRPVKDAQTDGDAEEAKDDESPTESKPTTQTVTEALQNTELKSAKNGAGQKTLPKQESKPKPKSEPEPKAEPKESERKSLKVQVYCPDLELWNGRIRLSEFTTAMEFRI